MTEDHILADRDEVEREHPDWWLYHGTGRILDSNERDSRWPNPPSWRDFRGGPDLAPVEPCDEDASRRLGSQPVVREIDFPEASMVNAAIHLRRPLLVTGRPGSGKSSLAYRISHELGLGAVLRWPITSRTTLRDGLYAYDAIGRVQEQARYRPGLGAPATEPEREAPPIGDFVHLGPLGTALLPRRLPRVLLIDELDKSDIDLPNDLLNVFEDGEFSLPELVRVRSFTPDVRVHTFDAGSTVTIRNGWVRCHDFPIVVITSNGEREFSPAFLRRCLRLELPDPSREKLAAMVAAHFPAAASAVGHGLIQDFLQRRAETGGLAADQLLNAVHLATSGAYDARNDAEWPLLVSAIWRSLSMTGL